MRVDLRGQDGTGLDPDHAVGHGGEGLVVGDDDDGPAGMAAGVPVSYTHLDVYKRQAQKNTGPQWSRYRA